MNMRKKLSIKNKIALSVTGIIIVFGIGAAIATYFVSKNNLVSIKEESLGLQAGEQAHETGQIFSSSWRLIDAIARQQAVIDYIGHDPQLQDPRILDALHAYDIGNAFDSIRIFAADGTVLIATNPELVEDTYSLRGQFNRALSGEASIEAVISVTTGRHGYYFSHPIRGVDGAVVGVLVGQVLGGLIDGSLRESSLNKDGRAMLIDGDGIIFYSTDSSRLYKGIGPLSVETKKEIVEDGRLGGLAIAELQYKEVVDIIRSYTDAVTFSFYDAADGEDEIVSVVRIPDTSFFLVVEAGTERLVASALAVSITLSIAALFAAMIAAAFIYFVSARLLRPIGLLKLAAKKIEEGDYAYRLEIETGDEFEEVANAFSGMTRRLQASYAELNQRVVDKTKELLGQLGEVEKKNLSLQDTQRAVLNILEDAHTLEIQIQEDRDQLRGILASMGEGLFVLNGDMRIILTNPMAAQILGIPEDKLKGSILMDVIKFYKGKDTIPEHERPLHQVINKRVIVNADIEDNFYWEVRGGRRFALGLVAAPISVGGLVGGVIIFRDLTREKNLNDARTSFISITSHQLRTPLTSLKWFLEMLMDGSYAQPLVPDQQKFADLAYQSADRMMGIINLLLQIARVEAGRVKVVPISTSLQQFSQDVVALFGNALDLKKQNVEITAVPDPLPSIPIDNDILGQVMQNLISNANRYAPEHTIIKVAFKVEGDMIVCSIADKGIGIAKTDVPRIFEKFYRAENALRMVPEGSGLGLSLVKSLVEGWGGTIWFESEEGKGTTFFFTIPLVGMAAREGEVGIHV